LKGSKNGHVQRLVTVHTHFQRATATPTPKTTAKPRGREDAGRRPGALAMNATGRRRRGRALPRDTKIAPANKLEILNSANISDALQE
jgi:hypothetical protein